jgi:type IV pilus assembly protein PilE
MNFRALKGNGFSLVELLVVLSIITLLISVGSKSYVRHIQKSKLLQAQSDLLMLASRMEQYKLFNLNYFGTAGTQASPENTGKPWIFESHSPANKPEQDRDFNLSIFYVNDSGSQYQITAIPFVQDGQNSSVNNGALIYYSDGRRGYDTNKDGYFTDNEMCWDC